jgi:hypothetical protein
MLTTPSSSGQAPPVKIRILRRTSFPSSAEAIAASISCASPTLPNLWTWFHVLASVCSPRSDSRPRTLYLPLGCFFLLPTSRQTFSGPSCPLVWYYTERDRLGLLVHLHVDLFNPPPLNIMRWLLRSRFNGATGTMCPIFSDLTTFTTLSVFLKYRPINNATSLPTPTPSIHGQIHPTIQGFHSPRTVLQGQECSAVGLWSYRRTTDHSWGCCRGSNPR